MSITLKSIIQDTYIGKVLSFNNAQNLSIPEQAGKILYHLYEYNKNGSLSPESIIFLETSNSISHIISILIKCKRTELDKAIKEEIDKIIDKSLKSEKRNTLIYILEKFLPEITDNILNNESEKQKILNMVLYEILTSRIYGELDEDTRNLINQPDHEALIINLICRIAEGDDLLESIKDLYISLSEREHQFIDEIARDEDIIDVKNVVEDTKVTINDSISDLKSYFNDVIHAAINHHFSEVHVHLDNVGRQIFNSNKAISKNGSQFKSPPSSPIQGVLSSDILRGRQDAFDNESRYGGRSRTGRSSHQRLSSQNRRTYDGDDV